MTLRNLMTSLLALTLMVFVAGCDSDTDESSNLADSGYDCFRGGWCSKAAAQGWFTEADGNIYAKDTLDSSGCKDNPDNFGGRGDARWALGEATVLQAFDGWYALGTCVAK
jgi:hypothetical protein